MNPILDIPEIKALSRTSRLIRIPNQIDVPVTPRVLRLIDTPEFQRLRHISQLGVVSFVYPAANHSRFEHSLGVYRNALLFLQQLGDQPDFANEVSADDATVLLVAALLHDIGHWPFCHPIEDIRLEGVPDHESFCEMYITSPNLANAIREDWNVDPADVVRLIGKKYHNDSEKILGSILSGPIDIDKMDYLYRDSLHAGVPYGQNFDMPRLIRSLCLNPENLSLGITSKGKTAAELIVFARYVMFSEVYWHPTVRSATAMLQRAFFRWHTGSQSSDQESTSFQELFQLRESEFIQAFQQAACGKLVDQLFGCQRILYKQLSNYNCFDGDQLYRQLAQQPYPWLVRCSEKLAELISQQSGKHCQPDQILIDAPPVGLEVQFDVSVFDKKKNMHRQLGDLSPVVKTLAQRQFDDFVKQVRLFVDPAIHKSVSSLPIDQLLLKAINNTN